MIDYQNQSPNPIASTAERTLRVLECVLAPPDGISPQDILEQVDISRRTLFLLLRTLNKHGYLEQSERRGGYRRGPEGYPLMVVAVMDWNGKAFGSMEQAELFFGDTCSHANQVKAMLHLLVTCSGTYVSETPGISADLTVALAANGDLAGTWNAVYGQAHMCDRLTFLLRQGSGRIELVKTGIASGADEVIAAMQVTGKKAVIRFLKDLGEYDCGAGHPSVIRLRRK